MVKRFDTVDSCIGNSRSSTPFSFQQIVRRTLPFECAIGRRDSRFRSIRVCWTPHLLGPSEMIQRADGDGLLQFAHALATLNTALLV